MKSWCIFLANHRRCVFWTNGRWAMPGWDPTLVLQLHEQQVSALYVWWLWRKPEQLPVWGYVQHSVPR